MCATLFDFEKPVVAAVNGHAIAGGCIIACAADYRMMTREPARIGIPELLVGVPFRSNRSR
jgi:enoyl-CoA hydratase